MRDEQIFEVRDIRQKEKFIIDDRFLNGYAKFVGIYATGVYVSLCRHANKGQKAWPSIKKIAEELNISIPMAYGAIWTLCLFNIIIKQRIGKMACNRYWLLDKKEWVPLIPEAIHKLLSDINSVNITDINSINITSKRRLHHLLTVFTSYSKETHSKETHSKGQKKYPPKADDPVDNSKQPFPKPTQKQKEELTLLFTQLQDLKFNIFEFIDRAKRLKGFYPPISLMIETGQAALKSKPENIWGYFTEVLKKELPNYFADLQIQEHQRYKEMPVAQSLKDVMVGIGKH